MPYIVFQWQDNSKVEDGHRVYRSSEPMNPSALPSPVATLGADVEEFVDETFTDESPLAETLYYRVSSYKGSQNLVSEEMSLPNPANVLSPDSPTWLFANGEAGFANTLGLDTLFTDTSGTTPVEEYGDAIALATNLAPNGPDMIQATGAERLVWGRMPCLGVYPWLTNELGRYATHSEGTTGWGASHAALTAGVSGILNRATEAATTAGHGIASSASNFVVQSGSTYTWFVVLKPEAGSDWMQLSTGAQGFPNTIWQNYNLSGDGALGNAGASAAAYEIRSVPGHWVAANPELAGAYVCMLQGVATSDASNNTGLAIYFTNNTDSASRFPSYAGSTDNSVLFTRAMIVKGARDIDWYLNNYQRTAGRYDISQPGVADTDVAYNDGARVFSWDLAAGDYYIYIAGEKGSIFAEATHAGGDFDIDALAWPDGPADGIPVYIGDRHIIMPVVRATPFTDFEKQQMVAYTSALGCPRVWNEPFGYILFDDFSRAEDGPLTTALTGQTWQVAPDALNHAVVDPFIEDGSLKIIPNDTGQTATYFSIDAGRDVAEMFALVSFEPGTDGGSAVLISTSTGYGVGTGGGLGAGSAVNNVTDSSIHIVYTNKHVVVGYFSGGDRSSGGSTAGELTNIATIVYNTPMATDGTQYLVGWRLDGDDLTVFLPDGSSRVVTSATLAGHNGRYAFFEHYMSQPDRCIPAFHRVSVN